MIVIIITLVWKTIFKLQVVTVVEGTYRQQSTGSHNGDVYEGWDHAILQTLSNSPVKVRTAI